MGGDALPGSNIGSRIEKMIVRSIETYQDALKQQAEPIIFDRGVLDYVGYAYRTNTPISEELHQTALSLVYRGSCKTQKKRSFESFFVSSQKNINR